MSQVFGRDWGTLAPKTPPRRQRSAADPTRQINRALDPMPAKQMQSVYFIQAGDDGPVKIGIAADPARRLVGMQVGNPEPLRLLGAMPADRGDEQRLHGLFYEHRIRGEWYRPASVVLEIAQADHETVGRLLGLLRAASFEMFAESGHCGRCMEPLSLAERGSGWPMCVPCQAAIFLG